MLTIEEIEAIEILHQNLGSDGRDSPNDRPRGPNINYRNITNTDERNPRTGIVIRLKRTDIGEILRAD